MLGLLIVLLISAAGWWCSVNENWGLFWDIATPVLCAIVSMVVLGLILRRLIGKKQQAVQDIMLETQTKVNRQIEQFNRRPPSSMSAARQITEKIQASGLRRALEALNGLKPFYWWNFLLSRQVNTMKAMLYFQLHEDKKVDELLPKSLLLDAQSMAIQLVRDYRKGEFEHLEKVFRSKSKRLKGDQAAFLAGVYAWMQLRRETPDVQKALSALRQAAQTSDHAVLTENIDRLVNGKIKHYTNSSLGENWYALGLEEPKMKMNARRQF